MVTSIKSFWEMTCYWAIRVFSTHFISFVWNLNQIFQVCVCVSSLLYILVYSFHIEGWFGPIFFIGVLSLESYWSCIWVLGVSILSWLFHDFSIAGWRCSDIVVLFYFFMLLLILCFNSLDITENKKSIGCVVCILEVMETNYSLLGYYIFIDQST